MLCEGCGIDKDQILMEAGFWEDDKGHRYWYPDVVSGRDMGQHPPGIWKTQLVCWRCRISLGYNFAIYEFNEKEGVFYGVADDDLFESIQPFLSSNGDSLSVTQSSTRPHPFNYRVLQSDIAVSLIKALFKESGYEIKIFGYENSMPEWSEAMKTGDPNRLVARLRNTPDFLVYDRPHNTMYQVEAKSTENFPCWRYGKSKLDSFRRDYPDAVLAVYSQSNHQIYVTRVDTINWESSGIRTTRFGEQLYEVDLSTFVLPPDLFDRVTTEIYQRFLERSASVLRGFHLIEGR
jgi:hypothetical protein